MSRALDAAESDRQATQTHAIFDVLMRHTGEPLSPANIGKIIGEINVEMREGPCSWAFK
jgi:hypothetical protein